MGANAGHPVNRARTPAALLAALLTVDGAGSGLDADLLDGVDGAGYVNTASTQTIAGLKTFTLDVQIGRLKGVYFRNNADSAYLQALSHTASDMLVLGHSGNADLKLITGGSGDVWLNPAAGAVLMETALSGSGGYAMAQVRNSGAVSYIAGMSFESTSTTDPNATNTGTIYSAWDGSAYSTAKLVLSGIDGAGARSDAVKLQNSVVSVMAPWSLSVDIGTGTRPSSGSALSNTCANFFATDGQFPRVWGESYGNTGLVLTGRAIAGTRAAPTATSAALTLFAITATGYDGTSYLTAGRGQYGIFAGSLWTTGNHETYHEWRCTAASSTTNTTYMRLMGGGRLLVGTTLPTDDTVSALQVTGAAIVTEGGTGSGFGGVIVGTASAGGNAGYRYTTGGTSRWMHTLIGSAGAEDIRWYNIQTSTEKLRLTYAGSLVVGQQAALATTATDGFLYLPSCAGTPTGVPTAYTGKVAFAYDTTNNKLYVYNGAWKATAALT